MAEASSAIEPFQSHGSDPHLNSSSFTIAMKAFLEYDKLDVCFLSAPSHQITTADLNLRQHLKALSSWSSKRVKAAIDGGSGQGRRQGRSARFGPCDRDK